MTKELFREDAYQTVCEATVVALGDDGIELDRTVFYPTGGGQPGDLGVLHTATGAVDIVETRKGATPGTIVHVPGDGAVLPKVGDTVRAEINWPRRHKHMRMHSALHVLCSLVAGDVTGGQVGEAKSRLDFNIPQSPDKAALNATLQDIIAADHPLVESWISDAQLDAQPDLVRTLSVQPPRGQGRVRMVEIVGVDHQPCGGTHVKSTAEIGAVRIGKIENKGKQNRRINIVFETQ